MVVLRRRKYYLNKTKQISVPFRLSNCTYVRDPQATLDATGEEELGSEFVFFIFFILYY